MLTVGLTGGIATGKSLVSTLLGELGATVVDTDRIYHELLSSSTDLLMELRSTFGADYFNEQGHLDRRKLGAHVFGNPEALQKLNRICHPVIIDEMMARVDKLLEQNPGLPLVFMAIPLLFEVRLKDMVDRAVLVYAPEQVQAARLKARDRLTDEEVRVRLASQLPIEEKRRLADIVIDNSGTIEQTAERVRSVLDQLMLDSVKAAKKA